MDEVPITLQPNKPNKQCVSEGKEYIQLASASTTRSTSHRTGTLIIIICLGNQHEVYKPLLILPGSPSDNELKKYPTNVLYYFNKKGWLCHDAWSFYCNNIIKQTKKKTVIYLDSLSTHTNEEVRKKSGK